MIRLTALNDESSRSSEEGDVHPKEPPLEIQEENALKVYNEALQEQRNGNLEKAETLYQQLLSSNLLTKIRSEEESCHSRIPDVVRDLYSKPSLMLKYSCLKNLAVLAQKKNMLSEALNYYTKALEVEGTDVTMWFQGGCVAMKLYCIKTALEFFLKGLEFSSKHWPSLDKSIICLFVLHDYVNCLYFISNAFQLDKYYTRGRILRDYIIKEQPSLQLDIKLFYPKINLHMNIKSDISEELKNKLLTEVLDICNGYSQLNKQQISVKELDSHTPRTKIHIATWINLGENILLTHEEINSFEGISFTTPINLKDAIVKLDSVSEDNKEVSEDVQKPSDDVAVTKTSSDENAKEISDGGSDKRNKKNKGSALMEELLWSGKRRSARVRSSLRGNPEPMDVAEALRRILPRKLLLKAKQLKPNASDTGTALDEDSSDTMDLYKLFEKQENEEEKKQKEEQKKSEVEQDVDMIVESEGYFGKKDEECDVLSFIDRENGKCIIDILKSYVMTMKTLWRKTWPNSLPITYIKCYQLMRRHFPMDFKMCTTESNFKGLVEESGCILLCGELCLEHSVVPRSKGTSPDLIFLQNLMELTDRKEMFESEEEYFEFLLRLYWLRCRIFLEKGQTNLAIVALNDILACYELFPQYESTVLQLKNCRKHNIISKTFTEEFLAYQSRKRSLAEVVRLYEDGSYQELTDILKDTFNTVPDTAVSCYFKEQESEMVDRQTQLSMLINGLYHLNEYKECIYWLETCCYESLQKSGVIVLPGEEEGESWMVGLDRFLVAIEDCLELGKTTILDALPANRLSRFVQTLCQAICKELEDSDRPPCPARPWIMLNTILISLEKKGEDENSPEKKDEDEDEVDIPSSILILFTAHEYLGRREWCNCNGSVLLFLILDQVIPRLRSSEWSPFRETVQQHLEQVIYCLYSHPSKKTKARYLTDHNVNSIPLTWERGIQLFSLFRPDEIPAYDSLRVNLISSETEVLFRRIAALIPDENDPVQISDKMTEFIVGKVNDIPDVSVQLPELVRDLFYVLGDYYFKTHEFAKAVNYLLMDLCANPDRVDSWASMALARASLLEQQLNSCDPLKDEVFLQSALSALRCYEHCLQLDNKQCALWIEYGSFVYTIHSFCSQRMKSESFNLSLEQFEELESTKNRMLETAKQAFVNANLIWYEIKEENERQDERWLHHYMLGKICEKNGDLSYFDHYEKAAELLYENEAEFPNKVGYTTPQTLAIEALEVYYRVHVCVIKNLELNEGKILDSKTRQLFSKHLNNCSTGAFARQISKGDLAKLQAKKVEMAQQEKQLKVIKSVLNDIISKIELESEKEKISVIEANNSSVIEPNISVESVGVNDGKMELPQDSEKEDSEIKIVPKEDVKTSDEKVDDEKPVENEEPKQNVSNVQQESAAKVAEKIEASNFQIERMLASKPLKNYQTFNGNDSDNYYITLDDLRNMPQFLTNPPKSKKKRRASRASTSSSSCGSEDIRYDDDSSSSSSSSDSSASSQSSSSSSSESSRVLSEGGNQEPSKVAENEGKEEVLDGAEKKSVGNEKADNDADESEYNLLMRCLRAFETCALRFPQHYKSVYRLAHFYFRSKEHRDVGKCKDLLLGRYETPNGTIPGLFCERKNTNFFNGIWRIPAGDVDRPGSFASHMSRSVLLLMELLRDLKDHKMLLEICLQLRKTPEPDKKYLREDERNQLSVQACNLVVQTLRKNVKDSSVMTLPMVLDCYRCYQKVQKHYSSKETVYADILLEAFKRLGKGDKCTVEQAVRFCQAEISAVKIKVPKSNLNSAPAVPKVMKPKKQEKKKSTPRPQITAKLVQKLQKPKKESQKKSSAGGPMNPNSLIDCWSSAVKQSAEPKGPDAAKPNVSGSQMYAEMLRITAICVKQKEQIDKKIVEQLSVKKAEQNMPDAGQKVPQDLTKPASSAHFQYPNFSGDLSNEKFKNQKMLSNSWFGANLPYPNPFFNSFQNVKKSNPKIVKQQSTAMKPFSQKAEAVKPEEPKAKTNFNIEDILGKPSLTVTKCQSGSSTTFSKDIEDKIKSISKEVNITKCSSSQAINLSASRKTGTENGKRVYPEPQADGPSAHKKVCRGPGEQAMTGPRQGEVELVIIDD